MDIILTAWWSHFDGHRQFKNSTTEYLWCEATSHTFRLRAPFQFRIVRLCLSFHQQTRYPCHLKTSSCSASVALDVKSTGFCGWTKWHAMWQSAIAMKFLLSPRLSKTQDGLWCLAPSGVLQSFKSLSFSSRTSVGLRSSILHWSSEQATCMYFECTFHIDTFGTIRPVNYLPKSFSLVVCLHGMGCVVFWEFSLKFPIYIEGCLPT